MKLIERQLRANHSGTPWALTIMVDIFELEDGSKIQAHRGMTYRRVVTPETLRTTPVPELEAFLLACRDLDASHAQLDEWRRDVEDPKWRDRRRAALERERRVD